LAKTNYQWIILDKKYKSPMTICCFWNTW
jgi:hypothetical protein